MSLNFNYMFTLEQIQTAHSKVKSGADFPAYIQELKKLGINSYETFVEDGHTHYFGTNHHQVKSPAKYASINITTTCNQQEFVSGLREHQQGKTDYKSFIAMSASTGIEKWVVSMNTMTCTYFDKSGAVILEEQIPE